MREAIVLAGGLGTRLRPVVPDLPKCLAPVGGRPFLGHVLDHFRGQGVDRYVFALGYRHDAVLAFLATEGLAEYTYTVEEEPLGTGGAIRLACSKVLNDNVIVINGDTLFAVDAGALERFHSERRPDVSLCLKRMREVDRYGAVEVDRDGRVLGFQEKRYFREGLINGGVYGLTVRSVVDGHLPTVFSFEKDFLEPRAASGSLYGLEQDAYFIDIGVPGDYERAQKELSK